MLTDAKVVEIQLVSYLKSGIFEGDKIEDRIEQLKKLEKSTKDPTLINLIKGNQSHVHLE